jgi:hypothetical protein
MHDRNEHAAGPRRADPEAARPQGMRRHEEPAFGYAVEVPAVFVALMNTVDPLARALRRLDDKELDEESKLSGSWPVGFADPEVVGDIGDDHAEPLRLLEFDVLTRPDPLSEADIVVMREAVREVMPAELARRGLAGFELLDRRETMLGALDALAFDYAWDGPRADAALRDRALVVWAPTPTAVYQVYYHCPAEAWDGWLPELERILASFELIERREPEPCPRPAE